MSPRAFARVPRHAGLALLLVMAVVAACVRQQASLPPPGGTMAMSLPADRSYDRGIASQGGPAAAASLAEARPARLAQPVDPISYLAYAYTMKLELPGDGVARTMDAHAAACRDAGLRVCQLVSSDRQGDPGGYLQATLALRAEPQWLQRFMAGVEGDARGAGGRIVSKSTTTEDLTRAIVDTEADLRAKRSLRDRLERLLAGRPGALKDLLDVERELARVQGQIDSIESNLTAMRHRVAMSSLILSYASAPRAVVASTFAPLGRAFADFIGIVVNGVAAIVTLVAVVLPWLAVSAPLAWLIVRIRRRQDRLAENDDPPADATPPPAPAV